MKLSLAIVPCLIQLNRYDRSTTAGREMGLLLSILTATGTVTVIEKRVRSEESRPRRTRRLILWSVPVKKGRCGQGIVVPNSSGASPSIDDILMPGGKAIGVKGSGPRASARIREVPGGQAEAERIFQDKTQGGKDVTPAGYPGTLIEGRASERQRDHRLAAGFQERSAND